MLLLALAFVAQTATAIVRFVPSADHAATDHYEVAVWDTRSWATLVAAGITPLPYSNDGAMLNTCFGNAPTSGQLETRGIGVCPKPFRLVNIGKPAVVAGEISATIDITGFPANWFVTVRAVGPPPAVNPGRGIEWGAYSGPSNTYAAGTVPRAPTAPTSTIIKK